MIGKAIALKVGFPLLTAGSLTGGGYYVFDSYVSKPLEDKRQSQLGQKGLNFSFTLKNQQAQSASLFCLEENLREGNDKYNLQLLWVDQSSAEIICTSGKEQQSGKLTLQKKQEVKGSELGKTELVEVSESDGPIRGLECDDYSGYQNFECRLSSQILEMTLEPLKGQEQKKVVFKAKGQEI
ncbi:hypothetical protein MHLP_00830 [Candidatus Mycoplasma haematolamae str. Purdue]|uniref:Uncharacterized protein n=1 Tax=Mycoplasma haematolamae (strain Purdue) TaxID=1212765 RepID=I7CES1_MYCHA|nr:hypothetical protein [Candidatus Mycoplasma haematolamae]AFO51746.1 hypothetical protein MHLP_00830 [Candidatus Mycoplasma haematolamae str. Purdue]